MAESTKAAQAAQQIHQILDGLWKSNAENARLRDEIASLKLQLRKLGQPVNDVFAGVVSESNVKHPQAEQCCPNYGGRLIQTGRTASCVACSGMYATKSDGTLGQRLSSPTTTTGSN